MVDAKDKYLVFMTGTQHAFEKLKGCLFCFIFKLLITTPSVQVIRRFDFSQSQTALSLIKFVEKSSNIFNPR